MFLMTFMASPRIGGNTDIVLNKVIEGLRCGGAEVEKYFTHELTINPCKNCGGCERVGRCVIDDGFQELFDKLVECDGCVFASPLYFMNVPARGKVLIDRCQAFWAAKYKRGLDLFKGRKRLGLLVSCSGKKQGPGGSYLFRGIEDTMTYVFDALGMEMLESLLFRGIDEKGKILTDTVALERARKRGLEMASLI